ncbi:unnamed protein product [Bursaphelenchus xylophilus]|uniref:(pine wood nematode) hypothetical protein n=1 Tax=Bursaphelenchus xylophilus TaxID=6326 RepID=A0A1I7S379_BURXY|nr:unnamed protein product [Bursaphelenchus xylophilus]CAG9116124.1 unnamed protein product [Bursaphelenchus xylophilus]
MTSSVVLFLLCGTVFVTSGQNLKCYSCDGKCDCRDPREELCPDSTFCYILRSTADRKVVRRGCALSCRSVNVFDNVCALCRGSFCNMEANENYQPYTNYDECLEYDRNAQEVRSKTPIGQDVRPTNGEKGERIINPIGQKVQQSGGIGQDLTQEILTRGREEIVSLNRPQQDVSAGSGPNHNNGISVGEGTHVHPSGDVGVHPGGVGNGAVLDRQTEIGERSEIGNDGQIGQEVGFEPALVGPAAASANGIGNGANINHYGDTGNGAGIGHPNYGPAPSVVDGVGTGAEFNSSSAIASFSTILFILTVLYKQLSM